ncbi:MAG: DUF1800 domain-containing protein [Actinomycetota bacterium]
MRGNAPDGGLATAPVSRRSFVRVAAIGGALAGSGAAAGLFEALPAGAAGSLVASGQDMHLLRRATFGPTQQLVKEIRRLGRGRWLDRQLDPSSLNDAFCEDYVANRYPDLDMTVRRAFETLDGSWDLMYALGQATIVRAVWSNRQLFEVMVDFWSNHLNVTNPHEACWWSRHDYDARVIRKHALGKFSNMLRASATHPAMMMYLNNAESSKYNPNENYGREILELHSVGVDGGYDEEDMRQSTLTLTGFGISWETGEFEYHPWDHYTGSVDVMGWHAANGNENKGKDVGLDLVDYLAHHPSTAERIARKLCYRFVSDSPPASLVNALAETYLDHDTAIVPVLEKLFRSKAFERSVGQKVRRPFEDVAATLRVLNIRPDPVGVDGQQGLYWMIEGLGHLPMGWVPPDGYPDTGDPWRSAGLTLGRWNMHVGLAGAWWPADHLKVPNLAKNVLSAKLPKTHGSLVDALAKRLVFRTLTPSHRAAVLSFLERPASDPLDEDDAAVGWRLPYLVALILDTPSHGIR